MKIRIRGNSLRLRLVKTEVARFAETGVVEEAIAFGGGARLHYSLEMHDGAAVTTQFDGSRIRVLVPREQALHWARSADVSLVGEESTLDGALKFLVEKDFTCINPSSVWQEDQSDSFANPFPSCGSRHE